MKVALISVAAVLTLIGVSLAMVLASLFFRPSWFLNDRTLAYLPPAAERFGIKLSWQKGQLAVSKPRLATHKFAVIFNELCVNSASTPLQFCADKLHAQIELDWNFADLRHLVRVGDLGRWELRGGTLATGPFPPSATPSAFDMNDLHLPWILDHARLAASTLEFKKITILTDDGKFEGAAALTMQMDAEPTALKLQVRAKDLCLAFAYADGCIDKAAAGAGFAFARKDAPLRLTAVDGLAMAAERFSVLIPEENGEKGKDGEKGKNGAGDKRDNAGAATEGNPTLFPTWRRIAFQNRGVETYHINVKHLAVVPVKDGKRGAALVQGSVELELANKLLGRLAFALPTGERGKATFSGARTAEGHLTGDIKGNASLPSGESLSLALNAHETASDSARIDGDLHAKGGKLLGPSHLILAGTASGVGTRLSLSGDVALKAGAVRYQFPSLIAANDCRQAPLPGPSIDLSRVKLDTCLVALDYGRGLAYGALDFACPLHANLQLAATEGELPPKGAGLDLSTHLLVTGTEDARFPDGHAWNGSIKLATPGLALLANDKGRLLATDADASFAFSQKEPTKNPSWATAGKIDMDLRSFAELVRSLEHSSYAIPAPLNVLDGTTRATAQFQGDSRNGRINVPLTFKTVLHSPEQTVDLHAEGALHVDGIGTAEVKPSLDASVVLNDLALTLPRISLREKFPTLFPDKRIDPGLCPPKPESNPSTNFAYKVKLDTQAGHPVRISTNLTKDAIPIVIQGTTFANAGLGGDVLVQTFGVEIFRRKATVKKFDVQMQPLVDDSVLDGNIEFKYTDITINILITGTVSEPIIAFESLPVRTEREIITTLIYGQDIAASDDDQLQTADDLSAAIADQMIGLASLYLLASTPVESVRYNPSTKALNARVRLDKQTSLNIGTTLDESERAGVRHRLTSTWSVETAVSKDQATGVTSGTALLEWSNRF